MTKSQNNSEDDEYKPGQKVQKRDSNQSKKSSKSLKKKSLRVNPESESQLNNSEKFKKYIGKIKKKRSQINACEQSGNVFKLLSREEEQKRVLELQIKIQEDKDFLRVDALTEKAEKIIERKRQNVIKAKQDIQQREKYKIKQRRPGKQGLVEEDSEVGNVRVIKNTSKSKVRRLDAQNDDDEDDLIRDEEDDDQELQQMLEAQEIQKISQNYPRSAANRNNTPKDPRTIDFNRRWKHKEDEDGCFPIKKPDQEMKQSYDSDEEMQQMLKGENGDFIQVEEFQMSGVKGVAYAAYQNEEITDYFKWNDHESDKRKLPEDLEMLQEISQDQPRRVMINEFDIEVVRSDDEEDEDDEIAFLGRFKAENLLYNVKKEIKIESKQEMFDDAEEIRQSMKRLKQEDRQFLMKMKNQSQQINNQNSIQPCINLGSDADQNSLSNISKKSHVSTVSTTASSLNGSNLIEDKIKEIQLKNLKYQQQQISQQEKQLGGQSEPTKNNSTMYECQQKINDLYYKKPLPTNEVLSEIHQKSARLRCSYPQNMLASESNLRLNEDQVCNFYENGVREHRIEQDEPIDDNEDRLGFFDKKMCDFEDEMLNNNLATKKYTSLKYFDIKQQRHQPIKRDQVEMCFEQDLEVFRITKNFKRCIRWMIQKGMLPESRKCPCCEHQMRVVNSHSKFKDGLLFKCTRLECRDIKVSIREGTIFDYNHLTLMEVLRCIFYYFSRGFNALQTYRDLKEFNIPTLQYQYVYDIYRKVRHLIHIYFQNHYRKHKLGHFGRSIEIDESKFTHHTKGGIKSKVWVLGFYERGTKDVRAFVMKDRSEITCLQMIRDNVLEGAEVYTDFWRGYNQCKEFYTHRVVNKQKVGGGPSEYQTTSRVESLWHILKRNIHTYSTIRASTLQRFLDEACWRIKFRTFTERNEFLMQLLNVTR